MTDEGLAARSQTAALVLLSCALAAPVPSFGQERDASIVVLAGGVAVTRLQRANEPLHYLIEALRGQTLLIEVEQLGLDVVVSVESPVGEIRRFNSPLFRDESVLVLIDDTYAGRYRLTVMSEEPTNAIGEHAISFRSLGADTDARYVTALRHMSDGARAYTESRGDDALRNFGSASQLWEQLGETRRQAQSLYSEAMVLYGALYDWSDAASRAKEAAALYEQLDARGLYANAMLTAGYSLMEVAQSSGIEGQSVFEDALAALHASFRVHEALGDDFGLANVENSTGLAYFNRGRAETQDFREAEKHYRHAAELFARLGEWREELNARHNLALISIDEGHAANAARTLEEILADIPPGKDPEFRGIVLGNLGVAYRDSGDFDAALVALSEAVAIHASLKKIGFEAFALRALGTTYQALGELDRADEYLKQALEKVAEHGRVRSAILSGLGTVAYQKAEYAAALDWHRQAVESTTSTVDRAYRQGFVVRDLVALRRFDEAITAGNIVLSGVDTPAITRADAALELGHAYLGLEQAADADERFATALAVYDTARIGNKQAEALNGRALAARARGDLPAAIQFGEESLQRIEALRAGVSAPELRAFYSAAHSDYYESQVETLLAAHRETGRASSDYLTASLSVSERARARMIVDLLNEAAVPLDRGELPEAALERERELYDELGALRYQRDRLLETPNPETAQLEPLVRRMTAIENELSLSTMAARRSGAVQSSAVANPLSAAEIQASLDDRSVLLQYALGSPKSFVWVVTRGSLQIVELADRATIESAARRVYEDLKTDRPDGSSSELTPPLGDLAALVLAPVVPFMSSDKERLIIAADGALGYIPFGVLPLPRAGESAPLLQTLEVSNVPSMSAVAAQRQRTKQAPPKTLAVFADPVFAATDPRLVPVRSRRRNCRRIVVARRRRVSSAYPQPAPKRPLSPSSSHRILAWS